MKCCTIFMLLVAMLVAVSALPRPDLNVIPVQWSDVPSDVSYPIIPNHRRRRSPVGRIAVDQPVNKDPSISAGYVEKVYENKHGNIVVFGEASKSPDKKTEAVAGIRGEFRWGGANELTAAQEARLAEIDRYRKEQKID